MFGNISGSRNTNTTYKLSDTNYILDYLTIITTNLAILVKKIVAAIETNNINCRLQLLYKRIKLTPIAMLKPININETISEIAAGI